MRAKSLGAGAATVAALTAVLYDVPQILQVTGVLQDPWDRILIFAPSLLLAPAFVVTMAAVCAAAPPESRGWGYATLAFAVLYAADVSQVYVTQLGVIIPADLAGRGDKVAFAGCCGAHMPATAVDLLGYTYMSLSTLVAVPVFAGHGRRRALLRVALAANGLVGAFLLPQLFWPSLIAVGALWMPIFPAAMALLALDFGLTGRRAAFDPSQGATTDHDAYCPRPPPHRDLHIP